MYPCPKQGVNRRALGYGTQLALYHPPMSGLFAGTKLEQPVTCERCGKPHGECACPRDEQGKVHNPKHWEARVRRERQRGKFVTVCSCLGLREADQKALLGQLKAKLGVGGAIRDGEMVPQGDHRGKLVDRLKGMGYPAKASGG